MFDRRLIEDFDWVLVLTVTIISIMGFVAIYSASYSYGTKTPYFGKQVLWFFLGLGLMTTISMIDYRTLLRFAPLFHFIFIILLVMVLFFGSGPSVSRVSRWLRVGPVFFQPSEFMKISLVLYLAHYFRDSRRIGDLGFKELIWPAIVTLIPCILIIKQPDLGTAGILIIIFTLVIFLVGVRFKALLTTAVLALVSIPFAWVFLLKPYQRNRIVTLINPEMDPMGKGYQIIQSKIAIGSGHIWGKGYMLGTQARLNFLPARHTDFIFSVYSEEWGFIGAIALVCLYLFLILWCLRSIGNFKHRSGTVLTLGVVSIMMSQIVINISMTLGIMPIVGMPLPFFSYGGSAMISQMVGIGLILNVRMRRFDI